MITNFELNRDLYFRAFFALCAAAFILFFADSAFATSTYSDPNDIVGNTLCKLTASLTGNTAKAVATIAIFTTGISLFMGKMQWTTAAMVAIGVAIIFASGNIVAFISGSTGSAACV